MTKVKMPVSTVFLTEQLGLSNYGEVTGVRFDADFQHAVFDVELNAGVVDAPDGSEINPEFTRVRGDFPDQHATTITGWGVTAPGSA